MPCDPTMPIETDSLLAPKGASTNGGLSAAAITANRTKLVWLLVALSILAGLGVGVSGTLLLGPSLVGDRSSTVATTSTKQLKRDSPYTATQFISFSINTLGGLDEYDECEGRDIDQDGVCYLGNADDLEDDLNHRFAIVKEVLNKLREDAYEENPEIDHAPHVLKIFQLPEFFFRGPHGAYSTEQLASDNGLLVQIGDKIREVIAHQDFQHFLFVFGTVIMATSPDEPTQPWDHPTQQIDKGDILYFNFAPVYRGGKRDLDGDGVGDERRTEQYIIPKKYISKADFLQRNNGLPNPRSSHLTAYDHFESLDKDVLHFMRHHRNITVLEDGILDIDGIRIGIELCLDHRLNVLWKSLQKSGGDLVDVHLITSAGMAIERGATPLRPGGVVYLTDGGASSAACRRVDTGEYDPMAVCRDRHNEGPTGLKHVPTGGDGYSAYIELVTCLNPDDAKWKPMVEGYYSNHATQGCAYTLKLHGIDVFDEYNFYPPSVEIYPTIDLP